MIKKYLKKIRKAKLWAIFILIICLFISAYFIFAFLKSKPILADINISSYPASPTTVEFSGPGQNVACSSGVKIDDTHYLNVYENTTDQSGQAVVMQVNVSPYTISKISSQQFLNPPQYNLWSNWGCGNPIIKIDNNHFLHLYNNLGTGKAVVLEVDDDYNISVKSGPINAGATVNSIAQIDDNHFLVFYSALGDFSGAIIEIEKNNNYNIIVKNTNNFGSGQWGRFNSLEKINDKYYLAIYQGPSEEGYATIISVDPSTYTIESRSASQDLGSDLTFSGLQKIDNTHFLALFSVPTLGDSGPGRAVVLTVTPPNTISVGGLFTFEGTLISRNSLGKINKNYFINTFNGPGGAGGVGDTIILNVNSQYAISTSTNYYSFESQGAYWGGSLVKTSDNYFVDFVGAGPTPNNGKVFLLNVTGTAIKHNVYGFGWNENIGWVSFAAQDCDNNKDGIFDSNPLGCPPAGTLYNDYGVDIDETNFTFSGYAWSNNVGWISFNEINPPDNYAFNSNCKSTCDSSNSCTACLDALNNFHGWAKIISMGGDGWIKFNKDGPPPDFKVWVDMVNGNKAHGWAWNENDPSPLYTNSGIGWVSFSCEDYQTCQGGVDNGQICTGSNCAVGNCVSTCTNFSQYQVYVKINTAPQAINLTAPNNPTPCDNALFAQLRWDFYDTNSDDSETAYRVVFDDDNDSSSPLLDTGKCTGFQQCASGDPVCTSDKCLINTTANTYNISEVYTLEYDKNYYWWVEVWDEDDVSSGLTQFDTTIQNGCGLIPPTNCHRIVDGLSGDNQSFKTYLHQWPFPNFYYYFSPPSQNEKALFDSINSSRLNPVSSYYDLSGIHPCKIDKCTWNWTAAPSVGVMWGNPYGEPFDMPTASTTLIQFTVKESSQTVTLTITDKDTGYACSTTTLPFKIKYKLPGWKETKD